MGTTTGYHNGNVTGNVVASDAPYPIILNNGTDGTDATFQGDVLNSDSSIVVNVGSNAIPAEFTGNLIGNVNGNTVGVHTGESNGLHTGDVTGDVTGDTFGIHTGNVVGNVSGDTSGLHTGNVVGNVTGATNGLHTGNVVGNVTGNLEGDVTGDLTGDTFGTHTGSVFGDVTGNLSGDTVGTHTGSVIGNVSGNLTGNVTGDLDGNVLNEDLTIILSSGSDVTPAVFVGNVTGNVTGTLNGNSNGLHTGNVTGDVTGDTFGIHTGDVVGNLTGASNGLHTGDVIGNTNGLHTGNVVGNVTGNTTGNILSDNGLVTILSNGVSPDGADAIFVGSVNGNVTGNTSGIHTGKVVGDLDGNVLNEDLTIILSSGSDVTPAIFVGNVTGNVTGDLDGDVNGNVTGNTFGIHTGDVTGNVTGDTFGSHTGSTNGLHTGNVVGNVTGDTTGTHIGPVTGDVTGNLVAAMTTAHDMSVSDIDAVSVTTGSLSTSSVNSSFIPSSPFNLGSAVNSWGDLHISRILGAVNIESTVATIGTLNVSSISGATLTGSFIGNLTGDVDADTVTANTLTGNFNGNIEGDTTQVTSGWDLVNGVGSANAFDVVGGVSIGKNLTVSESVMVGGGVTVTGDVLANNLDFANFNSDIIPVTDDTYNLGSPTHRWSSVNANQITVDTLAFSLLSGDIMGDVQSGNGDIVLDNGVDGTDATFQGDIISPDGTTIFSNGDLIDGSDSLLTSNVIGNVTGGITATSLNVTGNITSNIIPNVTNTYTLGDNTHRWANVYTGTITSGTIISTSIIGTVIGDLTGDLIAITTNAVNITTTGDINVGGTLTSDIIITPQLDGNIKGNILNSDDVFIFNSGGNGNDAEYTGNVTGDIRSGNGVVILDNGSDGTDAVFVGNLTKTTGVSVTSVSNSVDQYTGALRVAGGISLEKDIWIGGTAHVLGSFILSGAFSVPYATIVQAEITSTASSFDKNTGALVLTHGGLGVEENANIGGYVTIGETLDVIGSTYLHSTLRVDGSVDINNYIDIDITGAPGDAFSLNTDGSVTFVNNSFDIDSNDVIGIDTDTTLTLTGTTNLDINGGDVTFDSTGTMVIGSIGSTTITSGDTYSITADNQLNITSTVGDLWLYSGDNFKVVGYNTLNIESPVSTIGLNNTQLLNITSKVNSNIIPSGTNTLDIGGVGEAWRDFYVNRVLVEGGNTTTNNNTGDVIVIGGIATQNNLWVDGNTDIIGTLDVVSNTTIGGTLDVVSNTTIGGTLDISGITTITNTTQSVDVATGALVVDGGVGIAKNVFIGGNIEAGDITAHISFHGQLIGNVIGNVTGTLDGDLLNMVTHGVAMELADYLAVGTSLSVNGISTLNDDLYVDGNTTVTGNLDVIGDLIVQGTQTIINTETITLQDNMIILNNGQTGIPSTSLVSGFEVNRGTEDNYRFMFRETDDTFRVGAGFLSIEVSPGEGALFQVGELVTDITTGASGTVILITGDILDINKTANTADFVNGNTIDSASVGASSTIVSVIYGDQTQAVATREDVPLDTGIATWDSSQQMFVALLWETATDAMELILGRKYIVDDSVSTLTLPASPSEVGQIVTLKDLDGVWFSNPVTLGSNGNNIMGSVQDIILNVTGDTLELVWSGNVQGWIIL